MNNIHKIFLFICLFIFILLPSCNNTIESKRTYTVTVSEVGTYQVEEGDTLKNIVPAERDGYHFVNWVVNGEVFDINTPITSTLYISANYEINEYNVNFHILDQVETVKVTYKTKVSEPTNPSVYGYNFIKWVDKNQEAYNFNNKVLDNLDLYAELEPVKFTVTFDIDGSLTANSYSYLTTLSDLETLNKTGYTFDGWYDGESKIDNTYQVTKDVTLTAKFNINTYTVTFIDGDTTNQVMVNYNETVSMPTSIGKVGYKFIWWYIGDEKYTFSTPVTTDITITAKYAILTFKVTLYIYNTKETYIYNYGETIEDVKDPEVIGCTFINWLKGEEAYDVSTPITSDLFLTANFERAKYIVTIDYPGKSYTEEILYGQYLVLPKTPVKDGYHFDGWYDGENKYDFYSLVTKSFTLTPKFSALSTTNVNVEYNFGYDCYQTKEELKLAYYTTYYNFLDTKNFPFADYSISNLSDFMTAFNTWKYNGRNEMGGLGDVFAKNYLKVQVGGKLEDQPTTHFIGYCYQNNLFVDFINHLMVFFAYWRTDEGYSRSDPNGNDFFASSWASMVDTAKFFYFTGDTLQDTYKWFTSERVHYALDHIPSVGRVTLTYTDSESITLPTDITREGYTFLGWVDATGEKISVAYQSMMVYATWGEAPVYTLSAKRDNSISGSNTNWYCATPDQTNNGYVYGHRIVIINDNGIYKVGQILTGDGNQITIDYAYRIVYYDGASYQSFDESIKVGQVVKVTEDGSYITFEFFD